MSIPANQLASFCPICNADQSVQLTTGDRHCLQCHNEWNPNDVNHSPFENLSEVADPSPVDGLPEIPDIAAMVAAAAENGPEDDDDDDSPIDLDFPISATTPAVEVADAAELDPEAEAVRMIQAARDRYIGTTATVIATGGFVTVEGIDDDGAVWATDDRGNGKWYDVDELTLPVLETDTPDVADEFVQAVGASTLALAGLAIKAGVAAFGDPNSNEYVGQGPAGWIPPDADVLPIVEQGVAYAIACLIHTFLLDREQVAAIGEGLTFNAAQLEEK